MTRSKKHSRSHKKAAVSKATSHKKRAASAKKARKAVTRAEVHSTRASASAKTIPAVVAREMRSDVAVAEAQAAAVKNPFRYIPVAIGSSAGSVVFTNKITSDQTIGATGCLASALFPRGQSAVFYSTAIATGASGAWVTSGMSGDSTLNSQYKEGRFLAGGIRYTIRTNSQVTAGLITGGLWNCPSTTTEITGSAGDGIRGIQGINTTTPQTTKDLQGFVPWRPVDANDYAFAPEAATSGSTFLTTNVPVLYLSLWPSGTPVILEWVWHIEVTLKAGAYLGIPGFIRTEAHDFSQIMDLVSSMLQSAFYSTLVVGQRAAWKWAIGAVTAGAFGNNDGTASWWDRLRGSGGVDELRAEPATEAFSTQALIAMLDPGKLKTQIAQLQAEVAKLAAAKPVVRVETCIDDPGADEEAEEDTKMNILESHRWVESKLSGTELAQVVAQHLAVEQRVGIRRAAPRPAPTEPASKATPFFPAH